MASAGWPRPDSDLDAVDLTVRMGAFADTFAEQIGLVEAAKIPTAEDLIALVRLHVPRVASAEEPAPIFESAAYVGEWLRAKGGATWIGEGPYEPHLHMSDDSGGIIVLMPLIAVLRTASTAGYDGLGKLLRMLVEDVLSPATPCRVEEVRVAPEEDAALVVSWLLEHLGTKDATAVTLWRRCSVCASSQQESVTLPAPRRGWEAEAALAAGILAQREFRCECGGAPGEVSRLLMLRAEPDATRVGDIYVTPTHTRVACWTLADGILTPFDANALAQDAGL